MHPNPAFREEDQARALTTARRRGFGVLTAVGPAGVSGGVLASHVPFLLEPTRVAAHLSRGGALARHLRQGPAEALLIVSGPDAYVSPDWYGIDDQVPTWNYVAVHLRGTLRLLPDEALPPHLEKLIGRARGASGAEEALDNGEDDAGRGGADDAPDRADRDDARQRRVRPSS